MKAIKEGVKVYRQILAYLQGMDMVEREYWDYLLALVVGGLSVATLIAFVLQQKETANMLATWSMLCGIARLTIICSEKG